MSVSISRAAGTTLAGRFVVEREVGRGACGIVLAALDEVSGDRVALKVVAAPGIDEAETARFEREGRVLGSLSHPGIVRVVAFGRLAEGEPYVAMEWLEGRDLAAWMRVRRPRSSEAVEIARQLAHALAAAHAANVVHRDVKPSNVFLLDAGADRGAYGLRVKLVDFGVAAQSDVRLTQTGAVVGTPAYMAPEQARGDAPVDERADIYSLGATLFELIAGRPPHVGPTPIATLARLVTTSAPRLSDFVPDVPERLDAIVTRMLATSPDDRPASAAEVARELEAIAPDVEAQSERAGRPLRSAEAPSTSIVPSAQGTRLVTSIVALRVGAGAARQAAIEHLRASGADAVPLGQDAVVAHLGARRALGDEAARALDLGRALAVAGARVGVATGRTRVNLSRPVGEVVDRAASLANAAEPEQVLADATTSELARGRFEFQSRPDGSAAVGGALRLRRTDAGGGAPFVGREAELAHVLGAYDRCVDDRSPILVTITGAPGIGKSRLGREALARVAARPDRPRIVVVRCESYGRSQALGAAADLLRPLLSLPKGASYAATREALDAQWADATNRSGADATAGDERARTRDPRGEPGDDGRDLLARLIANEPLPGELGLRGARDVLWIAMTELLLRRVAAEPCVLVIEDMQWADPDSIAWLDHAFGRASGRPLFLLGMTRPELWREHTARFAGRDHVRVDLRPVSKRAARAIARALLGERSTDEMLDGIAAQAGGSPLFAEELARLTVLGRDAKKAPTIEAAIQVSLDALDEASRDALGRLSVFGLAAWDDGLEALEVPAAADVLRQLTAAEMLIEQSETRFVGTREWTFKHALVHDVAYGALPADAKKPLHALAARWLASVGEDAATVAFHFDLGGESSEAAKHWERAARRALATNALADAVRMAEAALMHADDKPTAFRRALILDEAWSRLDPRASDRASAIEALRDATHDEASEILASGAGARFDDARGAGEAIAERLGEVCLRAAHLGLYDEQARSMAALAARYAFAGSLAAAEKASADLLDLAEYQGIAAAAVDAWQTLAVVRQTRGELASALDARRNAARAASRAGLKEREAMLTMNVGFALTTIGARQEARQAIETGLALANAIGSQGAVRHGKMVLLGWAATFGGDAAIDAQLAEARAEADDAAAAAWVAPDRATLGSLFYRGCELLQHEAQGSAGRARALLERAVASYRATENNDVLPVALGMWAEALRRAGETAGARRIAAEAAELLERGAPSLLNEAPVFLTLHDACVDAGDFAGARDAIARALPHLSRRLAGLAGTPYVDIFVARLPQNAALLVAAEAYALVPPELERILGRSIS